jgi:glucose uptake protein
MFVVNSLAVAVLLCIVTMIGWGSWANTQKLAGKDRWQFPLYYWDYALGVFAFGLAFMITLGVTGTQGMGAFDNLAQADAGPIGRALLSGVLFNAANILLVVAIDAAGMSVAFPIGVGLALVIGTVGSYVQTPKGDASLLFAGVVLVTVAMSLSALAYSKLPRSTGGNWRRGVIFAAVAGCLMGFFYPQLMRAISPNFHTSPIEPGYLTPYTALGFFGTGLLLSNLVVNTFFMRTGKLSYADYFRGTPRLHSLGFVGGAIWMIALTCNVIASAVAGPAISYALGQGATLVAAIWGVFVWREFAQAPKGVTPLLAAMFACYGAGLALIGAATL